MRKTLLVVLFLGINLSLVFYSRTVFAQTTINETRNTTPVVTEEKVGETAEAGKVKTVKEAVGEKRETVQEKREEVKTRLTEQKRARVQRITQFMLQRFNSAIARLENIIARFESRIQQIALNRDTTNAAAQLALAKSHLEMAKAALAGVEAMVEALEEAEDMKTAVVELREKVKELKTHLMETHKALRLGVTSLKSASVSPTPTVSVEIPTTVVTQEPAEEVFVQ